LRFDLKTAHFLMLKSSITMKINMLKNPHPSHLGEILNEIYLAQLGCSQTRLAEELGCAHRKVNEIVNGKRAISPEFASDLESVLHTEAGMWVGYKIGYEMTSRLYYSWIGGVLSSMRGRGIARKLMEIQHDEIKKRGYSCIRTHTRNKYREMLVLNIKSGFDIIGVYKSDHDEKQTIMLEKVLD
jgi:addiction module HigA family antidote